jgi:hypothetical protein
MAVLVLCWLMSKRGSTEPECVSRTIIYHQSRNRAARLSLQKKEKQPTPRDRKKRRPPRRKRPRQSTVTSK